MGILLGILWESLLEVTNEELSGVAAELLKTVDFYFIKPMNFDNGFVNLDATTLLVHF